MFGIDEAGRGPVFGSMFIGCVLTPVHIRIEDVFSESLVDSKTLSTNRIHTIASRMQKNPKIETEVIEVSASQIDACESLTDLTIEKYAQLINSFVERENIGIGDSCLADEKKFTEQVSASLQTKDVCFVGLNKADEEYSIVSAASILAKSAREKHIEALSEKYGEIGSGYPSDPKTKQFLENYVAKHNSIPPFARTSWKTVDKYL